MKIQLFFGDMLISKVEEGVENTEHSTSIMPFGTPFYEPNFFKPLIPKFSEVD
jgi:hypothetical protein